MSLRLPDLQGSGDKRVGPRKSKEFRLIDGRSSTTSLPDPELLLLTLPRVPVHLINVGGQVSEKPRSGLLLVCHPVGECVLEEAEDWEGGVGDVEFLRLEPVSLRPPLLKSPPPVKTPLLPWDVRV